MNNTKKYNSEDIEQYLLGKMPEDEKAALQFEMMRDAAFRTQVQEKRRLLKVVAASALQEEENDTPTTSSLWMAPLAILGIFILGYFLWPTTNPSIPEPTPAAKEVTPSTTPPQTKEQTEIPTTKEKIETQPSSTPEKPAPKKSKQNRPIAMADPIDLVPNPYLETYMGGLRSADTSITINAPKNGFAFTLQNGTIAFDFQATLSGKEIPDLQLSLFDNKEISFENYTPLQTKKLSLTPTDNGATINFKNNIALKKGLYYFIVETVEDQEMLTVGKFLVD